ncbi:MAG: hypothetical protein QM346_09600, partial [Chloroflexota bacterium]|nr:hypothetical protein [Chloroflexota bacterium]
MMTSYTLPQLTYADEMWIRRAIDEDMRRLAEISAAWDAYYGVNQETLKPAKNEPHSASSTDNVVLNFAQFIVDTSTFILFGEDQQYDLDINTGPSERTPDEAWLDGMWAANKKMAFLQKLAMNGGVT